MDPEAVHILSPLAKDTEKSKSFNKKNKTWLWVIIAWIILMGAIAYFTFKARQVSG